MHTEFKMTYSDLHPCIIPSWSVSPACGYERYHSVTVLALMVKGIFADEFRSLKNRVNEKLLALVYLI